MSERPEVRVTFPGGLRVDAEYKGFVVQTDQPVHQGGEGSALSPSDIFFVSIATCAGFYMLAFCKEREIPTDQAGVVMRMEKDPETKLVGKITLELQLPPGFPEKYKNAVIRSVDTCTVKAHLVRPPAFEIVALVGA